ncbi:MAG: hypothetical protein LBK25_03785 [Treponema sp.]|jgi:hypothetical protein|nr:hypothetical protein [Treponema sp.]
MNTMSSKEKDFVDWSGNLIIVSFNHNSKAKNKKRKSSFILRRSSCETI